MTRTLGPAAIIAAAVAVPLCYVPGCESPFADPKLAVLLVVGGLGLAAWLLAWAAGPAPGGSRPLRAALAVFVLTTLLAAAVAAGRGAPGAPYAAGEIVRLLAIIGVAAAAAQAARDPIWRRRLFEAIAVAAAIVSLVGLLQHLQLLPFALPVISVPGATFGNRNMGGEAVAMSLPFALAALAGHRRPWPGVALLLVAVLYLAVTRARGAWLGGAAGAAAFLVVRRPALPRRAWLLSLPLAAGVLAAALLPGRWQARDANDTKRYEPGARVVLEALDPASPMARTRLGLWRRTLAMYRAHPLAGIGPGNFPVFFPLYAEPRAAAEGVMSDRMVPRRPHNEVLERLAETGPLGLAAFAGLFAAALATALAGARAARGQAAVAGTICDRDAAAAGAGSVAACLACGLTAFPLAMPATALLFGVSLGVLDAVAPAAGPAPAPAPARRAAHAAFAPRARAAVMAARAAAVAVIVGGGWLAVGVGASAYWRGQARAAIAPGGDRPADVATAMADLARAAGATRLDSVRFDIALRTAQLAVRIDRGAAALQAADRALALEPYSPHAWAARAAAELSLRDETRAADDAAHAMRLFLDLPSARATLEAVRGLETMRRDRDAAVIHD
jgi:O-antigen ligase